MQLHTLLVFGSPGCSCSTSWERVLGSVGTSYTFTIFITWVSIGCLVPSSGRGLGTRPLHHVSMEVQHEDVFVRKVALREVQLTEMAPEGRNQNTVQVQFEAYERAQAGLFGCRTEPSPHRRDLAT